MSQNSMSQQATQKRADYSEETAFLGVAAREPIEDNPQEGTVGYLRLFWDERRVVGLATLAGLALGTVLAFALPRQYQSTAQLMPPSSQSGAAALSALSGKAGGGITAMAGDLFGNNSTGALFVGILRSRTLADRLVRRFDLKRVYGETFDQDARKKLADNTGVSEDRKSGILSLSVVDHDPVRAAAIAQAYVEELERLVSELSTSSARRERIFLEERLKVVKRELDQASAEFSEFASKNTAINIPEQGKAMVTAAATLQGQLIAAESELKGLSEIYTANNVRVRSVQARVSELRRQLEKMDGDSGTPAKDGLPAEHSDYPSIRELPLLGVAYADLLRRTKIEETVYETLTQQYELAKVQEAKDTPSVRALDPASLPERKSYPPRFSLIFLFAWLGFAGGAVWVKLRDRWQQVEASDPGKVLAQEVLYSVRQGCRGWLRLLRRRVR